jgi:hypothetical protein
MLYGGVSPAKLPTRRGSQGWEGRAGATLSRSPRLEGRNVAPRFWPRPDADAVEGDTGEQCQQQHAPWQDEAHAHSPHWNGDSVSPNARKPGAGVGPLAPAEPDGDNVLVGRPGTCPRRCIR